MDLSLRSIETNNWSADKFTARLYPAIQSCDTDSHQLTQERMSYLIDHNMDVHKDVHYQVKKLLYDLDTCRCH